MHYDYSADTGHNLSQRSGIIILIVFVGTYAVVTGRCSTLAVWSIFVTFNFFSLLASTIVVATASANLSNGNCSTISGINVGASIHCTYEVCCDPNQSCPLVSVLNNYDNQPLFEMVSEMCESYITFVNILSQAAEIFDTVWITTVIMLSILGLVLITVGGLFAFDFDDCYYQISMQG